MLKRSKFGTRVGTVILSLLGLFVFVFPARAAYILETGSVINGYRSCTWRDNGNGTSTLSLSVNFKWGFDSTNGVFWTRGFLIYAYDKNGKMKPSDAIASTVWLNGISHSGNYLGDGYTMYHGAYIGPTLNGKEQWINSSPFSANVEFLIYNSMISDWPAISIRAGNFTKGNDIGEVTGAAYFSRYNGGPNCQVIDPVKPPPPTIGINMTAPDWNLGELRRGEGEKVLSSSSDQLCFTYIGASASGKQFIINAGSANGVAGNRYRLKNLNDATQLVPYSLTLDSGTSNVSLPNASNKSLSLNSSGKTCFAPTFKTTVDQTVDEGDYSDVLTFTVITKS